MSHNIIMYYRYDLKSLAVSIVDWPSKCGFVILLFLINNLKKYK